MTNIKVELLKRHISDMIINNITEFEIDENKIADTVAIKMLSEIQEIIQNDSYSDFDMVEKIVCIFGKYKIDAGTCHDF